nr:MAG TPA: hypothetical protein [Caudoviricetes sp.]
MRAARPKNIDHITKRQSRPPGPPCLFFFAHLATI